MFKNISLSLVGLIFVILIAVVFFKKKRYANVDSDIYRILIVWTIVLLLIEMSCDIIISFRTQMPLVTEFLCRLYILFDASWFVILIGYIQAFLEPEKYKSTSDVFFQKSMVTLIIISSVMFFVSCFLELTYTSATTGEFNVIGGKAVFVLYAVFFTSAIFVYRALSKNLNHVTFMKRLPMILYLILFSIMKLFQYVYTDVNDLGFLFAFCIVSLYFTIENQDIKLVDELEKAKESAILADKYKTEFLSKMSHEIRTPMNAIVGFSENLMSQDSLKQTETITDVKNIYDAGKNLLDIINNILFFSKIESETVNIEKAEYSLLDLTFQLNNLFNSKNDDLDFKLNISLDEGMPINYIGDKAKIYVILKNLINSFFKINSNENIDINVNYNVKGNQIGQLHFVIKGKGIKKEFINTLSEEFSKKKDQKVDIDKLGLELFIAKKTIDLLDAKISFNGDYETNFVLEIEFQQQISKYKKDVRESNSFNLLNDHGFFDCSKYKVLIVDDNQSSAKITTKLLQPYNIKIESIRSGIECIDKIKLKEKYDMILLDSMMPKLDGIETLKIMKKIDSNLPPIIMTTTNLTPESLETYEKFGFDDCLYKPIDIVELNRIMNKYFKK